MYNHKFPDFIVAGFQKCGTWALRYNLNTHPDISTARCGITGNGGEFNFFRIGNNNNTFERGVDWYKSHFLENGNVWGEVSPNYSFEANENANKIKELVPNIKIIFTIRNPVDRAYSAYNHAVQLFRRTKQTWNYNYDPNLSFMKNIKKNDSFHINYIKVLKTYEKILSRDQILVVCQEKLIKQNKYKSEYSKIFNFLNVTNHEFKNKKIHVRKKFRPINQNELEFLKKYYMKSTNELFDWLGYKIEEWM